MIAEYIAQFWRRWRAKWEYENLEVRTLDESDDNNIREYQLSADAANAQLIADIRRFASHVQEGWIHPFKLGALMPEAHAYKPLLHANGKGEVTVRPVPLNDGEKQVVEKLVELASSGEPCLEGRELFLIRNLSRGRGVSFFDDHAYHPDFIVWLKDDESQHIVFLDPKGLVRFGPEERKKVGLHTGISGIEERVRKDDPTLSLHAYVLSATPPDGIGDEPRSQEEWEERGVYFLKDSDWPRRVVGHVLASAA